MLIFSRKLIFFQFWSRYYIFYGLVCAAYSTLPLLLIHSYVLEVSIINGTLMSSFHSEVIGKLVILNATCSLIYFLISLILGMYTAVLVSKTVRSKLKMVRSCSEFKKRYSLQQRRSWDQQEAHESFFYIHCTIHWNSALELYQRNGFSFPFSSWFLRSLYDGHPYVFFRYGKWNLLELKVMGIVFRWHCLFLISFYLTTPTSRETLCHYSQDERLPGLTIQCLYHQALIKNEDSSRFKTFIWFVKKLPSVIRFFRVVSNLWNL